MRIVSRVAGLLVLASLAATLPASVAEAGAVSTDWSVRTAAGVDTNPMRIADDGANGAFVSLGLRGKLSTRVGRSARWFADARLDERRFDGDADLADRSYARLRTGWSIRPRASRAGVAFGLSYEIDRSTYIDRETAERYTLPDGGGQTVDIGDRYDRDIAGAFFNAQFRASSRVRLVVRTSYEQSRYREDYEASVGLSPLDSTSLSIRPEVRFDLSDAVQLGVGVDRTTIDYDERPALDTVGDEVAGVTREYEYTQLVARLRYEPSDRWNARIGLRLRDRQDTYAGYYDYDGSSAYAALERGVGTRGAFTLYASHGTTEYAMATVSGNGQDEPRGGDVTRWTARYRHELSDAIELYGELGTRSAEDADPIYAHDRTWSAIGVEFRK